MDSLAALLGAVALVIAQWVLPMVWQTIPYWVQVALLCLAGMMLLMAVILPFLKSEGPEAGGSFNQEHSGRGDNVMDVRR